MGLQEHVLQNLCRSEEALVETKFPPQQVLQFTSVPSSTTSKFDVYRVDKTILAESIFLDLMQAFMRSPIFADCKDRKHNICYSFLLNHYINDTPDRCLSLSSARSIIFQFLTPETCSRILFLYRATSSCMLLNTACRRMFFSCKMVNSCSSSASFLFLFALQAWLALLFCSLILLYFSSSVNSSILTRLLLLAFVSVVFSSTSPLKTLVSCFPVVSSPSTSLEVEMLKPSTPQTGVWRQDSCPCVIIVSCAGSFKHSVVSRKSGFRLAEICSIRLPKLEIEFNEVLSGLIPLS